MAESREEKLARMKSKMSQDKEMLKKGDFKEQDKKPVGLDYHIYKMAQNDARLKNPQMLKFKTIQQGDLTVFIDLFKIEQLLKHDNFVTDEKYGVIRFSKLYKELEQAYLKYGKDSPEYQLIYLDAVRGMCDERKDHFEDVADKTVVLSEKDIKKCLIEECFEISKNISDLDAKADSRLCGVSGKVKRRDLNTVKMAIAIEKMVSKHFDKKQIVTIYNDIYPLNSTIQLEKIKNYLLVECSADYRKEVCNKWHNKWLGTLAGKPVFKPNKKQPEPQK